MTIIYIHGVKVRDPEHGVRLEKSFRRWLEPKLRIGGGATPKYYPVYWGGRCREVPLEPRFPTENSTAEGRGAAGFPGLGSLREAGPSSPLDQAAAVAVSGPVIGRPVNAPAAAAPPLSSVPPAGRADFIADLYLAVRPRKQGHDPIADEPFLASLADAAASVAADWDTIMAVPQADSERAARLLSEVESRLSGSKLLQQGGFLDWMSRAGETLNRAARWPGDAVSTVFAELRPTVNEFVAYFLGDVLAYLNNRGETAAHPGDIPQRVLKALKAAHIRKKSSGEKVVVVTHSMGGQLLYDIVTFFAQADADLADLKIDHWFSCGCQVSFFAELGLFKGQPATVSPQKLARPAMVQAWTNFYDRNDLVGFVTKPVFDGVDDIEYDTGYGLAFAHSGFLARPSFFEAMAARL
jgi:hypothetical protein